MDYSEISDSIAGTIETASTPLTDEQKVALAGSISVWLEKAHEDGRSYQAILELQEVLASIKKHNAKLTDHDWER